MSDFEIEEVRDIDAVWGDLTGLFLGLYHHHDSLYPGLVDDWQRRWRTHLSSSHERLLLIGRVDGEAVGFMSARIQRDSGVYQEQFGFLEDAYVEPEQRGNGLAQAMLEWTEAWCLAKRIDLLRLSVHAQNELGRRFWAKRGFAPMMYIISKTLTEPTS